MGDKKNNPSSCYLKRYAEQRTCGGVLQREHVHKHLAGLTKTKNNNNTQKKKAKLIIHYKNR